ncbi:MAG: hypothetical protein JWQ07_5133 [Ramlibacter sp.]|nr:hypothetical protein [Ramlibacter sp.]
MTAPTGSLPIQGNTSRSSRRMILSAWLGTLRGENLANHSRATASKLSAFSRAALAPCL